MCNAVSGEDKRKPCIFQTKTQRFEISSEKKIKVTVWVMQVQISDHVCRANSRSQKQRGQVILQRGSLNLNKDTYRFFVWSTEFKIYRSTGKFLLKDQTALYLWLKQILHTIRGRLIIMAPENKSTSQTLEPMIGKDFLT
jgi:hypothetical protein